MMEGVLVVGRRDEPEMQLQWAPPPKGIESPSFPTMVAVLICLRTSYCESFTSHAYVLASPGSDIPGANFVSNTAYDTVSGTSQAAPFVAGVAALYLERWPTLTPAQVATRIKQDATRGEIHTNFFQFLSGTPNLLLTTQKLS